ncbi:bifunctional phosphoribosyl-AMP cyclohydrolase/phosphoribosyl-ATP diphosphatase HisIE [Siminovitchia sp. FSL H7-0308]|uniref:Histidine biosynthesis bifunctional protein HisIE n=1 Tax=Siminovitchia thermophila TaxID=1245522 RepID=A0ABS2R2C2_9BACI|nr:bifunctional phosphoribosyl-AMP cyclohydrolase/phosphoribosyl-ATP diphosphatase HisIE [Siminovitchia thermophila]MBM7713068.1 phosphoribosyl-ATP pyrophosphohydrolase/phosphoribosyl-AMP cyclohydrolase [Siminovitchia thermophila]ONK24892.1 bifunctional phosphoribosyl-AMP cyclohydrolase/phosphoribosyl-ATP diphosphatase [Bacillus sp. VT-16-64]
MEPDFSKGLLPAVIVDDVSKEVLMLGYMDETAYRKTLETKETWFYSRSRQEYWNKGATSGNKQIVKSVHLDCDNDSLLIYVEPLGPACHTGEQSCFYNTIVGEKKADSSIFASLMAEINERQTNPVEGSYTTYLFQKGIDKISKKLIEEAGEIVIAAKNKDKNEVISECGDLLYHSLVLLAEQGVSLEEVYAELEKRSSKKGNAKPERPEIENW